MSEPPPAGRKVSPEQAKAGDHQARERDPHGVGSAEQAGSEEPSGHPTSDRHATEAAAGPAPAPSKPE